MLRAAGHDGQRSGIMLSVVSGGDPWAGCPPGWQRVMAFCARKGHRKFLGRGWAHRFADGFPAAAFDPGARCIERTGIKHGDGGVTFRLCARSADAGTGRRRVRRSWAT